MKMIALSVAMLSLSALTASAVDYTIYANAANYGKPDLDGSTEAKGYGTIQDAMDAYKSKGGNLTIICVPGRYDKGGYNLIYGSGASTCGVCRVVCTRSNVTIRSRDGKAHGGDDGVYIVGQKADTASGCGEGAIRGFGQYWNTNVQLRGLTFTECAVDDAGDGDKATHRGAAVFTVVAGASAPTYMIDCVVTNCAFVRGLVQNGTCFRTLFCDNEGSELGRQAQFYSCIFTRNTAYSIIGAGNGRAINCTITGNWADYGVAGGASGAYNNIFSSAVKFSGTEISTSLTSVANNVTTAVDGRLQLVAPILDDYRVLAGAPAATAGDPAYLAAGMFFDIDNASFPKDELYKDFYGNAFTTNGGTVVAGAVNAVVTPAGGAVMFSNIDAAYRTKLNGHRCISRYMYAFPTNYPATWTMEAEITNGKKLFSWGTSETHGYCTIPETNGLAYVMAPPLPDGGYDYVSISVASQGMNFVDNEVWLDSEKGNDTTGNGSFETPWRTLAKAATASGFVVAYCKPGTYAEGEDFQWSVTNRVWLNWKNIRYIGVGGPEVTFFEGAPDPNPPDPTQPGCGPAAIRFAGIGGTPAVGFQHVTFRNSYTLNRTGSTTTSAHQGGVIRSSGSSVKIMDCDIVDCGGPNELFCSPDLIRCRFRNNKTYVGGSRVFGCLVENEGNQAVAANTWPAGRRYFCSVRNGAVGEQNFASVYSGSKAIPAATRAKFASCIAYACDEYAQTGTYVNEDPLFVAATGGRLSARSVACQMLSATASDATVAAKLYVVANRTVDGVVPYTPGWQPVVGACQVPSQTAISFVGEKGGLSQAGTREMVGSETVTLTAGNPGTRPCVGYTVNGVTNLFDETASRTFTAAEVAAAGSVRVDALYTSDWYANANTDSAKGPVGDDANTGFTPKTAVRTLKAVLEKDAFVAGDTLHAAAGVYNEGEMAYDTETVSSRALVKGGCRLVADEGPEKTFIVGAAATGAVDNPNSRGCGEGAVRAVRLLNGTSANKSLVSGFTLTGGRTRSVGGQHYTADNSGGGVCSEVNHALVENCIISNNASYRGGGARWATCVRCRFYDNVGVYNSGATGDSAMHECVVDHHTGADPIFGYGTVDSCSFGPNNNSLGTPGSKTSIMSNCVFYSCAVVKTNALWNCYCTSVSGSQPLPTEEHLKVVPASDLVCDAECRPVIGQNVAIDKGKGALRYGTGTDVYGGQRVYNGTRDVGAVEADWRPVYRAKVGRRFDDTASAVTPGVRLSDDVVLVPEGESISAEITARDDGSHTYRLTFTVAAGGTAALTVDGVTTAYGAGAQEVNVETHAVRTPLTLAATAGSVTLAKLSGTEGLGIVIR